MSMTIKLTTVDNPFDPFTQWDDWYAFDESKGYHTCSYLARIAIVTDELGPHEEEAAIVEAIDEIIKYNILGLYRKVTKKDD